jgi:hypothetical protein
MAEEHCLADHKVSRPKDYDHELAEFGRGSRRSKVCFFATLCGSENI